MQFIALLRGINVGGNNKIEMPKLKALFESLNFTDVKTYINSGNAIFSSGQKDSLKLSKTIQSAIQKEFKLSISTLIISAKDFKNIASSIPSNWNKEAQFKCDVLFLWPELNSPKILKSLSLNPQIEDFKYTPGAIIWHINIKNYSKSKFPKVIVSDIYKQITIRNSNTVRKLQALLTADSST